MLSLWPFTRSQDGDSSSSVHEDKPPYSSSHIEQCDAYIAEPDWEDDQHRRRVEFTGSRTYVYGYPSSGGFLVLPHCTGVDLAFLQLARFEPALRSDDARAEDRHCQRMRRLGAWFFPSADAYEELHFFRPDVLARMSRVVAAWPGYGAGAGGVWVLKMDHEAEANRLGLSALHNAFNMEERCQVVEKLGGRFYGDPSGCPHLELEDGRPAGVVLVE